MRLWKNDGSGEYARLNQTTGILHFSNDNEKKAYYYVKEDEHKIHCWEKK